MGLAFYKNRAVQKVKGQSKWKEMLPVSRCHLAEYRENISLSLYMSFKSLMSKQNPYIRINHSMKILLSSTLEKFRDMN